MKIVKITEVPYDGFIYTPQVADNHNYLFDNNVLSKNCQGISKNQLQKILTRFGKNVKVILVGSNRQIDNKYLTKYTNGLSVILDACAKPSDQVKLYAVTLQRVIRSKTAEWAETIFSKWH